MQKKKKGKKTAHNKQIHTPTQTNYNVHIHIIIKIIMITTSTTRIIYITSPFQLLQRVQDNTRSTHETRKNQTYK